MNAVKEKCVDPLQRKKLVARLSMTYVVADDVLDVMTDTGSKACRYASVPSIFTFFAVSNQLQSI